MTRTMAETFYRKHREEPFFEQLVSQMISGPSLVLALCSRDAVRVGCLMLNQVNRVNKVNKVNRLLVNPGTGFNDS